MDRAKWELVIATNTTCSKSDCFVRPITVEMDCMKLGREILALISWGQCSLVCVAVSPYYYIGISLYMQTFLGVTISSYIVLT